MARYLLTIREAAAALGVSERHIKNLIQEATISRKSRWRFGRELVDLAPLNSQRRMVRVVSPAQSPQAISAVIHGACIGKLKI